MRCLEQPNELAMGTVLIWGRQIAYSLNRAMIGAITVVIIIFISKRRRRNAGAVVLSCFIQTAVSPLKFPAHELGSLSISLSKNFKAIIKLDAGI